MARCIIVDDEPLSRDVLRTYLARVEELELVAECRDAIEANQWLSKEKVDILFLDIQMPGLTGISLARSLVKAPLIIFTTAYPKYAVEGFELNALDYLVKPFSFARFLKAVNRALDRLSSSQEPSEHHAKIIVKADRKLYALDPGEILYLEGQGDYIRLHLEKSRLVVHDTLRNFMGSLPEEDFMRIHKSYAVNLRKIRFIEGNQVRIGEDTLPVSPNSREELLSRFSGL
jgi:DNA-binding LytR/AlgR family response regulator